MKSADAYRLPQLSCETLLDTTLSQGAGTPVIPILLLQLPPENETRVDTRRSSSFTPNLTSQPKALSRRFTLFVF